jgi:serine/threonine protein phosphatase PrpC
MPDCHQLDDEFLSLARMANLKAGSTLLLSVLHNGKYSLSNIGDSVGILVKQNGAHSKLTVD